MITTGIKAVPITPRTDDPREVERWQRLVAGLANTTMDDVANGVLSYATTAIDATMTTNILKVTAPCTVTIPLASDSQGKTLHIDNAHNGVTTVVSAGTIEGEVAQTMTGHCCMALYSDVDGWRIM